MKSVQVIYYDKWQYLDKTIQNQHQQRYSKLKIFFLKDIQM